MSISDGARRVNHGAEEDREILRQVYRWAQASPAIYLEGSGYRDAEDFLDPPRGSVEYIVFADDRPVALLTFIPLATVPKVYQVGLITNPEASLRKICKILRGFMGAVFERMAQALFVDLPARADFSKTRKLARFFGFEQVSETIFLISKYGHTQRSEADSDGELHHQFPGRVHVLPVTPEEQELKEFDFNQTRYDAGTAATFGKARQDIIEGTGGHSGITNPVLAARMQQIGLEELADREASTKAAADRERNQMGLQNKQFLATLRRPQYIQTGATSSGTGTTTLQNQQSNLLASLISGGLGLAGAFA